MGPGTALLSGLRRGLDFTGRSSRAEFWWAYPMLWLIGILIVMFAKLFSPGSVPVAVLTIASWGVVLAMASLGTRRLHDAGMPRWLFVIAAILGQIAVLMWLVQVPRYQGVLDFMAERNDVTLPISGYEIDHLIQNLRNTILPYAAHGLMGLALVLSLFPTRKPRPTPAPAEVTQ